jgi:4-aminobutyrate aminotransferase/(S)-3-amino-2-methylpropionate transaminase
VLGEGGFVVPPKGYLTELATICRRFGILVIADEVQTGFGRTGRMFACEHDGLVPDLLVAAKSLAAGLPLAAIVGRAEVMDSPGEGGLGGTYIGTPAACAAAHAVLDRFESGDLLKRAEEIGIQVEARARCWAERFTIVGDIRRSGAMVGIELVQDRATKAPASAATAQIVKAACQNGVLLIAAGAYGNVIRCLAPLVITDEELNEALEAMTAAMDSIAASSAA